MTFFFAVVTQRYEPEVQSPGGFLGNDVIIRCNVPAFVKEHVTVTSWLQEPSFNIYPSPVSGKWKLAEALRNDAECEFCSLDPAFLTMSKRPTNASLIQCIGA
jgi:hypothetical protein